MDRRAVRNSKAGSGDSIAAPRRFVGDVVQWLAVAGVYFVSGKIGLALAFGNESASAFWPPTGIALVAVLLLGHRIWPAVWIGAWLVNATTSGAWFASASIATGNTLEALLGGALVNRFACGVGAFDQVGSLFRYMVLAAVFSTAFSATIGVATLELAGLADDTPFASIWLTWWLGDLVSNMKFAPLILVWIASRPCWQQRTWLEFGLMLACVAFVGSLVFGGWLSEPYNHYPIAFVCIPAMWWAAFRFGKHGAVTGSLLLSCVALFGTLNGTGPFAVASLNNSLLLSQAFVGTITATNLVIAAAMSERQRSLQLLSVSELRERSRSAQLEAVLQAVPAVVWIAHDPEGRVITGNAVANEFLRLPPGSNASTSAPEDERPTGFVILQNARELTDEELPVQRAARGEEVRDVEIEVRFADGSSRFLLGNATPLRDPAGDACGSVAAFMEITDRRRTELAFAEAKNELQLVTDTMSAGVTRCSRDLRYLWVSPSYARWIGRTSEEIAGRPIREILGDAAFETIRPYIDCVLSGVRVEYETELHYPGRDRRWISAVYVPTFDAHGVPDGWVAHVSDVTRRRELEEAHRESEAQLQFVTDTMAAGVSRCSHDRRYLWISAGYAKWLGRPREDIIGRSLLEVLGPETCEIVEPYIERVLTGERVEYETQVDFRGIGRRWVNASYVPTFDSAGVANGWVAVILDITRRKELEERLQAWQSELERQVEQRTAELAAAHREMKSEVEERHRLEGELADIVEREQLRLGRELHEGIGQELTGIGFLMAALRGRLESIAVEELPELTRLQQTIQRAIEQTRRLARSFYPVELEQDGLLMALYGLASDVGRATGIECEVDADENSPVAELKGTVAIQLFRIAQEAVDNAVRHAQAQEIQVCLTGFNGSVTVRIEDDGRGLPHDLDLHHSVGLRIMRHRARMVGGTLEFGENDRHGVTVTCTAPVTKKS